MKVIKLLLILVSFLLVISAVSAITTYGEFQNQQQSININYGQSINFNAVLFSVNPPIDYSVNMYDNNYNLIKAFDSISTSNNFVSNSYTITQADYQNNKAYTIIIQGKDNKGDSSSSTLKLQVGNSITNNAPILNIIGNKQINEGQLLQFTVIAVDPDNNPITLSTNFLPTGAKFTDNGNGNGVFSWTPSFTQSGIYNPKFTASDGSLNDFEDITITVVDVAQGNVPTITINNPKTNEVVSGIYNIRWTATDPDQLANTLDIKIEYTYNGYAWTNLEDLKDNNDGIFTWDTRSLSNANDYKIRITATDNDGNTGQLTVDFILNNQFTPTINIRAPIENEIVSRVYNIMWEATDSNQASNILDIKIEYRDLVFISQNNNVFNKILNFFAINNQNWVTLENGQDNNDGIFTWDTKKVANGNYQLRIIVTDDNGNTATGFVNSFIIFNGVLGNHNPIITSNPALTAEINKLYNYDVDASDQDNDPLTYSLIAAPSKMIIDASTGLISWTPNSLGNYDVTVQVSDNKGGIVKQSFTIKVILMPSVRTTVEEHSFMISNIILKQNKDNLGVYIDIDNIGNNNEDVQFIVTDLITGKVIYDNFDLNINQGTWKVIILNNIGKGRHIIKVDAISSDFKDTRYAYTYIS